MSGALLSVTTLITIILVLAPQVSYSQQPQNATASNSTAIGDARLLSHLIDKQSDIERSLGGVEARVEQNAMNLQNLRMQTQDTTDKLEQHIDKVENDSVLLNVLSILAAIAGAFVSGYVGFSIHNREYNAELAKTHFEQIKTQILTPYCELANRLKELSGPDRKIRVHSLEHIMNSRTLDYNSLHWEEYNLPVPPQLQTLNVQLMRDVLDNHYPQLIQLHEMCTRTARDFNTKIEQIASDVFLILKPITDRHCTIVSETELQTLLYKSDGKNLFQLDVFAQNLVFMALKGIGQNEFKIEEHNRGDQLAVSAPENQMVRIAYPTSSDKELCKKLIQDCIRTFYSDDMLQERIAAGRGLFSNFNSALDTLGSEIDKIQSKTVLRIKKKWLFSHSCDYIKP